MKWNEVIMSVMKLLAGNISLSGCSGINAILKPKTQGRSWEFNEITGKTEEILS